jgi:predicted HicB family RNase H-like nuclease
VIRVFTDILLLRHDAACASRRKVRMCFITTNAYISINVPEYCKSRMSPTMLNSLTYKNFKAVLKFEQDSEEFITVKLIGVNRLFKARNLEAAEKEFQRIVDIDLSGTLSPAEEDFLKKEYSGKIALRMGPLLHQDLVLAAHRAGKSLNAYIEDQLQTVLETDALGAKTEPVPQKVMSPEIHQLLENEEAASQLFQEIQKYLEEKINIFQFPIALKKFLIGLSESLEEIEPYVKSDMLSEFVAKTTQLLQKFSH